MQMLPEKKRKTFVTPELSTYVDNLKNNIESIGCLNIPVVLAGSVHTGAKRCVVRSEGYG
jgi:hypothetical protein